MNESLYIVIPAYNEEANILSVVESWYPILENANEDSRLVIAPSGSVDKTKGILEEAKAKYPKIEILDDTRKEHGPKVIALYKLAIRRNIDWIFQTDSDGQTLPSEFNDFWQSRNEYDAIFGNRVTRGDGFARKMVELVLRLYLFVFFGSMVPDANAPFRLMKSSVVKKYIGLMPDDFNLPNAILTMCMKKFNEKIKFSVITFRPRQGGKNSINFKRIFSIGKKAISDFIMLRKRIKNYNPQNA